ncbi:TonB-dependent receptor [Sphingomonas sp. LM7]|uniref:TonB-dependent receptor n=1 Tax=Sphingomonas sp. LM7 TaxID=1938607 RepID=UPI000983C0B7|nr:TonB-dependent receptor [Sphingomonas sp. LM7]AQR72474.1 TonB-dependent receptor [Sphingomonas sp. LM7]
MKKLDLLAATALGLLATTPAFAQDAGTPPTVDETMTQDYQGANDIVVTATRRNETVQDVPIAITAIGPELLQNAGVENVRDLEQLAPSLQSSTGQSSATGTTIYIRGITTGGDNPGFEPAVGVFIDGVFRARAGVAISELPELERVEVLRGPQGTLFGRNTSAGALSIFTAQPQFETHGYVEGTYGNYNAYGVRGAFTGPVSESLALRVDGGYRKRDGYINDANSDRAINDVNRWNVRGQALLDSGDITLRLIGDYYETDEQCCGAVSVARGSLAPVIQGVAASRGRVGLYTGPGSDRTQAMSPNRDYAEKVKDWGFSGELGWQLGDVKLTSITAYRNWQVVRNQDIDFSGVDRAYRDGYRNELTDFTQELRLQGSAFGGKLDWLIGGFYLNESNKLRDVVQLGNDANAYVDTIFSGSGFQFFGSYGVPTLPQLGAALQGGPALPANVKPLLGQLLFLQNPFIAPGVRLQQAAAANPALLALLTTPLPGNLPGQGNNPDDFRVKTNAFALFTHNIINVTDKLSLTLGARWNHESKDMTASINNNTGACSTFYNTSAAAQTYLGVVRAALGATNYNNLFLLSCNPAVNTEFNGNYQDDFTDNEITGTAKLAFKVSDKLLTYASYDHGYKSGGYNLDQATFDSRLLGGNGAQGSDLQFGAETVDAYEIGFKASPSRAFSLNVAAFYMNFYNLQSLVFAGNNFVVQNVPKSISKGVEMESTIRPARDLTFQLGYSWISARYDGGNDFTGTPLQGQEGRQFNNQPEHTVTVAGTWTPRLTDGINGLIHLDMRYNSEVNIPSSNPNPLTGRTSIYNQGYPLLNAAVGVTSADGKWRGEFFVENLTNQFYYITGFAVPEQTGNYAGYPGMPRFFGGRVRVGF